MRQAVRVPPYHHLPIKFPQSDMGIMPPSTRSPSGALPHRQGWCKNRTNYQRCCLCRCPTSFRRYVQPSTFVITTSSPVLMRAIAMSALRASKKASERITDVLA
jgi:hypothetical protein